MANECKECGGEGWYEVPTGYRQYGMGYGDCEQTWEARECPRCEGSGEELEPEEPPPHTSEDAPPGTEVQRGYAIELTEPVDENELRALMDDH